MTCWVLPITCILLDTFGQTLSRDFMHETDMYLGHLAHMVSGVLSGRLRLS